VRAAAAALLAACAGCDGADAPAWRECAAEAGLAIPLCSGGDALVKQTILEVNGTGAALADLDGDGDLDVVLVDGSTRARLAAGETVEHVVLLNDGVRDGVPRFVRQHDTGLSMAAWASGIAAGDVDRDGRTDLVIGGIGEDALFLNRTGSGGACRFEKRALPGRASRRDWTSSLALADADGDGLLDIYLARYLDIDPRNPPLGKVGDVPCTFHGLPVMCGPHGLPAQPDVLLLGTADGGFRDASESSAIRAAGTAYGLGVLFADLDADGWPDLYVANDSVDNFVLRNRGDGTFEDRSALSGAATDLAGRAQAGMGVDLGDLDRDGDFELVVTNFSDESNALYRNDGRLLFRELSAVAGLAEQTRPLLGWGVHLDDFDADGWLDLYTSNGHVYPEADDPASDSRYAQPQHLYAGQQGLRFGKNSFPDATPYRGRASVRGDLDGDGDLDLLTLTLDGAPRLYLNGTDAPERQMLVTLRDGQRPVFGATLRLELDDGLACAQAVSSSGFQGSNDPRLHLAGRGPVRGASVLWPGGQREELDPQALRFGEHVTVERGAGVVQRSTLRAAVSP
jgi:enediyne biosynthesis protein E4